MNQLDLILQRVGAFGKWQRVQFAILAPAFVFITWQNLLYIFIAYKPVINNVTISTSFCNDTGLLSEYNVYSTTILNEWPILCTETTLKALVQFCYFVGIFVGTFVFYQIAKKVGRKRTALISVIFLTICGSVGSYSYFFLVFLGFRFFTGLFVAGLHMAVLFMCFEMTGSVYHTWLLTLWNLTKGFGYILLTSIAASFSEWNIIYLISSVSVIILTSFSCLVPESAKWLLTKGRKADTERLLRKMAVANGHILKHHSVQLNSQEIFSYRRFTSKHVTKDRKMCIWSIMLSSCWILHEFAYYVFSLVLPRLNVRLIFVSHCLSGFVEILAVVATLICIKLFPRRISSLIFCAANLLCCIIAFIVPQDVPAIALSLIAKFALCCSFGILQNLSIEMYPSEIRLLILLAFVTFSKIGAALAPFAEVTIDTFNFLPFILAGTAILLAALLIIFLPETFRRQIETATDANTDNENNGENALKQNTDADEEEPEEGQTELKILKNLNSIEVEADVEA